jgi:ribosomal protein S27AE
MDEAKLLAADAEPRITATDPEPSRTCPNCGSVLTEQKCRLLCPNRECGYSMSCSDFY